MKLEEFLEERMDKYDISTEHRESVKLFLSLVRQRDELTYKHSVRVGLLGSDIAERMLLDPKVLFYAGTLHDVGKVLVDTDILQKTEGFNEQDMAQMRKHPIDGYRMLKGLYDFSAEVVKKHHYWQKNGYPKTFPKSSIPFSHTTQAMIDFYSRLLALTDFYDALTSRKNDKFEDTPSLPGEKAKAILLENNKDITYLIEGLYQEGIFGTEQYLNAT